MQLQTTTDGEAVPKRSRTRKRHWREKWLVMSEGSTIEARGIKQLTRGLKLRTASYVPRVIPKNLQRPRSAESEFGLKWQGPRKKAINSLGGLGRPFNVEKVQLRNDALAEPLQGVFHTRDKVGRRRKGTIVARKPLSAVQEFKTFDQDV
jgi:hypothetical protein